MELTWRSKIDLLLLEQIGPNMATPNPAISDKYYTLLITIQMVRLGFWKFAPAGANRFYSAMLAPFLGGFQRSSFQGLFVRLPESNRKLGQVSNPRILGPGPDPDLNPAPK